VVGALCEELVRVKDSLDLFVRSDRASVGELQALVTPLKQIADTLAVLGFGQPRKVILDQIDVVGAIASGQREPSDAVLMDVAGALLYVEATLAGMAGPERGAGQRRNRLPTTDVEQIHQVVIKEARNGLEQAKDAIIEFIASQWNHDHLARVPELLTQVRGGLAMIAQTRAANLLDACNRYIQEQLLVRKAVPDWTSLDTLADAITGVEYYLERLRGSRQPGRVDPRRRRRKPRHPRLFADAASFDPRRAVRARARGGVRAVGRPLRGNRQPGRRSRRRGGRGTGRARAGAARPRGAHAGVGARRQRR
jgi:chemosensory pili system protein ChpA (sensor histidine kinase/response regulator)